MIRSAKGSGASVKAHPDRGMHITVAFVAIAAVILLLLSIGSTRQAANAAPYGQCDSVFNTPGLGMDCTVEIVNNLDMATGVTSSTTTYTRCSGAANTALTCEGPTTTSSTELVTSVSQCNSSLDGGGASMHCSVTVTNNIVGDATAVGATVNQCNDSLTGGGIVLRACNPDPANTSGATINQCNNSDNGGGSSLTCLVTAGSTTSAALPVTVSQCNYSANGGGSLIVCSVGMTTNVTPAEVVPPEETPPPTGGPAETSPPTGGEQGEETSPPTSEVLGDQKVKGLADTGSTPISPLNAVLLGGFGLLLVLFARITRPHVAPSG